MQFLPCLSRSPIAIPAARASLTRKPAILLAFSLFLASSVPTISSGQEPSPAPAPTPITSAAPKGTSAKDTAEVTEEELKQLLIGKPLFLRGGYLGDSLSFNEHGDVLGHPIIGSYTLSAIQIERVRLTRHKVELEGARYALHFLGGLPGEDPSSAVDRVKITPKKKILKISIDREQVVKEKKIKEEKGKGKNPAPTGNGPVASSETDVATLQPKAEATAAQPVDPAEAAQTEKAADPASQTSTTSPAHAAKVLRDALDRVFASGMDEQVRAHMPEFWQLYYKAQAAGVEYRPSDPKVLRSSAVDQQARVVTSITPDSNEYAQANGIAGRALYRTVIGVDGKPGEIAVVRPIGFGLDENAVAAIRKASFQPAIKAGQPVAESLDLVVLFRIYSKRTSIAAPEGTAQPSQPVKPGPYSVKGP